HRLRQVGVVRQAVVHRVELPEEVEPHHPGPLLGQPDGVGPPLPPGHPADQRHLAVQATHHRSSPPGRRPQPTISGQQPPGRRYPTRQASTWFALGRGGGRRLFSGRQPPSGPDARRYACSHRRNTGRPPARPGIDGRGRGDQVATRSEQSPERLAPEQLDRVVIRFAGDSGDGMQLTGDRFTTSSALLGNDLATFPDFPAEIRAPAGTLAGVSAFQVHISDHDILTPGDAPNVLVAMNPAALRANVGALPKGATLLINVDAFDDRSLAKAGYDTNPLTDGSLGAFTVYEVPMTSITQEACKEAGVKPRDAERSKNFFALGLVSWLYTRPVEPTLEWITQRFAGRPQVAEANTRAFRAGFDFGETAELFVSTYEVRPAAFEKGEYVQVTGNQALAWGLITAARLANLPLFLGSYPITPASDILHELSRRKEFGVRTFQAEDEIAGIGAALGAAFGGALGVTTTSGPGLDLKSETVGLAINLELPLIIVDVQRGGPSTGLPTKTEQADLLHAMYGRQGEAPLPIVAAQTPSDCFATAIEAARLAVKYRTPVILLSDGYLANGAEPWRLPDVDALEPIDPAFASEPNHTDDEGNPAFWPYVRDGDTLARPWAPPGVP